ncbi:hypothetical protein [Cupriavidus lacunae]|nr:hypothetical protein [Cupriavidus lacunae]
MAAMIGSLPRRWMDALLLRLSPRTLDRLARAAWGARSLFDARARWEGIARYEWGRDHACLRRADAWRSMAGAAAERMIDRRLLAARAAGRDVRLPDLDLAARALAQRIERIWQAEPERPVIVSPFHFVSQYANVYVVDAVSAALRLPAISIVSGIRREAYGGEEATLIAGLRVQHTYDETGRNSLGLRIARALRRDRVAVIFADVPPYLMQRYPMETVGVTILERPARIHSGVFRIGAPQDALLLPFYLRFANGRFSLVDLDAIELAGADAPQRVADDISRAIRDDYPNWILAGHPSQYGFAPLR